MPQEPVLVEISSETIAPRQVKLTILVPSERRERARHEVAQELGKRERVRGFRPGHIPTAMVVSIVGEAAFESAVMQRIGPEALREAVKSAGLQPSAPAQLAVVTEEPLVLEALVPLQPEVELGDYLALRQTAPEVEAIDASAVDAVLEGWRNELAVLTPFDGPAERGDIVEAALVGTLEGETVVDDTFRFPLDTAALPAGSVPPEAVEALLGAEVGDQRAFNATYSEFWPEARLQGRDVALHATVRSLARKALPDLDDTFAAQVAQGAGLSELRERIGERMAADRAEAARDAHVSAAVQALVDQARVEYPPQLLENEVLGMLDELRASVEKAGLDWDAWIAMQKDNEERLLADIEERSRQRLERSLVLQRFAEAEGIRIERADVDRVVMAAIRSLPGAARGKARPTAEQRARFGNQMLTARVLDRLLAIVSPEEAPTGS